MNMHPAVDDHAIDLQWSDDGTGNHDYNLLQIYGGSTGFERQISSVNNVPIHPS